MADNEYASLEEINQARKALLGLQPTDKLTPEPLRFKEGVSIEGIQPRLKSILDNMPDKIGFAPRITSGFRSQAEQDALPVPGKAPVSKHTSGGAVDIGIKDLAPDQRQAVLGYLNSIPETKASIHNANHIHAEYVGDNDLDEFGFPKSYKPSEDELKEQDEIAFKLGVKKRPEVAPIPETAQIPPVAQAENPILKTIKDEAASFIRSPFVEDRPEYQQKPEGPTAEDVKHQKYQQFKQSGFPDDEARKMAGLPPAGIWDEIKETFDPNLDRLGGVSSPIQDAAEKLALRVDMQQVPIAEYLKNIAPQSASRIAEIATLPNRVTAQGLKSAAELGAGFLSPQNIALAPVAEIPGAGRLIGALFAPGMLAGAKAKAVEAYDALTKDGLAAAVNPAVQSLAYGTFGALGGLGSMYETGAPPLAAEAPDVIAKAQAAAPEVATPVQAHAPVEPLPKIIPDLQRRAYEAVMSKLGGVPEAAPDVPAGLPKIIKNPERAQLDALVKELGGVVPEKPIPTAEVPSRFKSIRREYIPEEPARAAFSYEPQAEPFQRKSIVTVERGHTSEIVDLRSFDGKKTITKSAIQKELAPQYSITRSDTPYPQSIRATPKGELVNIENPQAPKSLSKVTPIPESPKTISAQMRSLKKGLSEAVLVTPGAEVPAVPKKFKSINSDVGTWIYDPTKLDAGTIQDKVFKGEHGELLGHVEPKSIRTTQGVMALDKQGNELKTSVVSPENVQRQADVLKQQFPEAKIETGGEAQIKSILDKRSSDVKTQDVYHGTSSDNAAEIRTKGFNLGKGKGISGETSEDFIFVTKNKGSALSYVKDRVNIKSPEVVSARIKGKILEIPNQMWDYEAFAEAQKKMGVPLLPNSEGALTMLDLNGLKAAMKREGYGGIEFKDRGANGKKAIAAIHENLSVPSNLETPKSLKSIRRNELATQEGLIPKGNEPEYQRIGQERPSPTPSRSNRILGSREIPQEAIGRQAPVREEVAPQKTEQLKSRVYERLQAERPDLLTEDVLYNKMNMKQDVQKAVDLIQKDKDLAYRVAMGVETLPDQTSNNVNIAMAEKALQDGNHGLYTQLVKKGTLDQTRRGQEIVTERGRISDNSTTSFVKQLIRDKMANMPNYLEGVEATLKKKSKNMKAMEVLDREVEKAFTKIKEIKSKKGLDLEAAQKLIDSLACK